MVGPGHAAVRFTNPTTGGDALTTIRTEMHRLAPGADTPATRTTASAVWMVFSGGGEVSLDSRASALARGDVSPNTIAPRHSWSRLERAPRNATVAHDVVPAQPEPANAYLKASLTFSPACLRLPETLSLLPAPSR